MGTDVYVYCGKHQFIYKSQVIPVLHSEVEFSMMCYKLQNLMEMSGQLHNPITLPQRKQTLVSNG
jgi:hypothetical protein